MRFLVTGGAGFVGSSLAFELEAQGHSVVIADDFSSGDYRNLLGFKGDVIAASICDTAWLDGLKGRFDAVFHEAAITDTTVTDQKRMMQVNVEGFKNILNFAASRKIKRVVYASSAGVYGNGACPMSESATPTPENVYGFSKAIMDNVAREFCASRKGFTAVGLRYFNVYGPREYYKGAAASMMYQLYLQMKAGKRPRIFKYGEQMRDFIYIKDVVAANMCALKAKTSCVVNVGTGKPENFNRVIECLNSELGLKLEPDYFDNPYSFYQNKTQAETRLAAEKIGFKAAYPLNRGIADYVTALELRAKRA